MGHRREKSGCVSLGPGAKKCSYPDALAGGPMRFATASSPSLAEAEGLGMPRLTSLLGHLSGPCLTEHVPNLRFDLPCTPKPFWPSAPPPLVPLPVKGPPSPSCLSQTPGYLGVPFTSLSATVWSEPLPELPLEHLCPSVPILTVASSSKSGSL